MRLSRFFPAPARSWLLAAALSGASLPVAGAPVRVTTWDLDMEGTNLPVKSMVQDAGAVLKKINPDVILLQRVPDWQTCNDLAAALKPAAYKVSICSSFRSPQTGKLIRRQAAILSKSPAYISWDEAWAESGTNAGAGGFAFAAIHVAGKNIAFFCIEPDGGVRGDVSAQVLKQAGLLRNWTENKVVACLVGGEFSAGQVTNLPAQLTASGFSDAMAALANGGRLRETSGAGIFIRDHGRAVDIPALEEAVSGQPPVTVDLDFDQTPIATPAGMAAAPVKPVSSAPTNEIAKASGDVPIAGAPTESANANRWWPAGLALGALVFAASIWMFFRRSPSRAAVVATAKGGPVVMAKPAMSRGRIVITHQPGGTATSAVNGPNLERPTVVNIDAASLSRSQSESPQLRGGAAELHPGLPPGLLALLSRWLREKFVRRLTLDRAHLLETQRAAELKILAVDQRLAKVETELQQRYRAYERRIDELLKELAVAKEENREMIRVQIALVKAEMEKERARARLAAPEV